MITYLINRKRFSETDDIFRSLTISRGIYKRVDSPANIAYLQNFKTFFKHFRNLNYVKKNKEFQHNLRKPFRKV